MKNPCLLIIDVQEKLVPVIPENQKLLKNIKILIPRKMYAKCLKKKK